MSINGISGQGDRQTKILRSKLWTVRNQKLETIRDQSISFFVVLQIVARCRGIEGLLFT